jgi:hypothetical protein
MGWNRPIELLKSLCTLRCLFLSTLLWPGGFPVLSAFAADLGPAAEKLASRCSLIGLCSEGALLAIDPGQAPSRSRLFLRASDPCWKRCHGAGPSPAEVANNSTGVDETLPLVNFQSRFTPRLLPEGKWSRFSPPR